MIKVTMRKPNYLISDVREKIMLDKSYRLPMKVLDGMKNELDMTFKNKCAYCESKLKIGSKIYIDLYRPVGGARNSDGKISKEHYWWLRYEWDNNLPVCIECNSYKSNRFPVLSHRVGIGVFNQGELANELPAIFHPYYDDPEEYFLYSEDGYIYSDNERARITIDTLNLNRIGLVERRKNEYSVLKEIWETLLDCYLRVRNQNSLDATLFLDKIISQIKSKISIEEEFCGLKRQFFRLWLRAVPALKEFLVSKEPIINELYSTSPNIILKGNITEFQSFREYERVKDNYDIKSQHDRQNYFSKRRHIERIVICNFRTIANLDIDIKMSNNEKFSTPWLMMLGENGTGKSTVLHAIALTLMDEESRRKYVKNAGSLLKKGTNKGFISVYLSGDYEPTTLRFESNRKDFISDIKSQRVIMLGYGSTRLLPKRTSRKKDNFGVLRVENLFNPIFPLVNASKQLYQLNYDEFEEFIPIIKSLLLLTDVSIKKDSKLKNKIVLNYDSQYSVSIDELSVYGKLIT